MTTATCGADLIPCAANGVDMNDRDRDYEAELAEAVARVNGPQSEDALRDREAWSLTTLPKRKTDIPILVEPFKKGREKYKPIKNTLFSAKMFGVFAYERYACALGAILAGTGCNIESFEHPLNPSWLYMSRTWIQGICACIPKNPVPLDFAIVHLNDSHSYSDQQMIEFLTRVEAGEFS